MRFAVSSSVCDILQEKRRMYEQQQQKMEAQHTSFLDSIRNEVNEEEEDHKDLRRAGLI